jgi:hypothetical protein
MTLSDHLPVSRNSFPSSTASGTPAATAVLSSERALFLEHRA